MSATSEIEMKGAESNVELQYEEDSGAKDAGLPPRKGNMFGSSANLIKAIIGSGVLGLPSAFAVSGWALSIIVLAVSAFINAIGLHFVTRASAKVGDRTANFGGVAEACVKWLAPVADFFMFMTCFGACVSYLIIAGDSIPPFITGVAGITEGIMMNRYFWITLIWVVIGIPLACVRNINFLAYPAATGILFIFYVTVLVILFYISPGSSDQLDACLGYPEGECVGEVVAFNFSPLNFVKSMPTFVFALGCAPQILPVYNELKKPTAARINAVIGIVTLIVMGIYSAVGIFGYLTYGDLVQSNILNNYPTGSLPATVARFGIGFSVAISYPLYAHPARQSLMHMLQMILEISGKPEKAALGSRFQKIAYWIVTFLVLVITYLLGVFVGDLGLVFSLIGSLAASTLGFTLPGLFFFMMFKGEVAGWYRGSAFLLFIFGLAFSVVGTATTFM